MGISRALGLVCGVLLCPQYAFAVQAGDNAPDFTLVRLMGGTTVTLSQMQGKVVYLDFWDSWCAPCRESLPAMSAFRDELPREDFEVVAVNLDADPADGRRFIAKQPVSFPVVGDAAQALVETYALKGLPTSFLLDRQGVVRRVHMGFKPKDMPAIKEAVAALIAE